ncbi:unnamed protein product [Cuscuta campestris]|nr:unnamed protein product [Cuscuta campestris]
MSRRNGNGPKLDLKLNLSPPTRMSRSPMESPGRSSSGSPPSSCVSSEEECPRRYCSSPEVASMVLVGCPSCLMYVMVAKDDPKCPKCKSTVLLDPFYDHNKNSTKS